MILQALSELRPNCKVEVRYNDDGSYEILSYEHSEPKPTEKQIHEKIAELQANYDSKQYQRDRLVEYPSIEECVHAILDDDLEALQAKRTAVKTKYPKPE